MKFAREFRTALIHEGFPPHWVETAIPYGSLKKCLKKVESELRDVGLDPATLKQFLDENNIDYHLEETDVATHQVRPRLTVTVHFRGGVLVDAALTPATRSYLEALTFKGDDRRVRQTGLKEEDEMESKDEAPPRPSVDSSTSSTSSSSTESDTIDGPSRAADSDPESITTKKIEVPLVFDAQFFSILQQDIASLSRLQDEEEASFQSSITALKSELSRAVHTTSILSVVPVQKSGGGDDMPVWREIFRLYLDANVFFSTLESDHGDRTSTQAAKALQWWQDQVHKQGLVDKFRASGGRGGGGGRGGNERAGGANSHVALDQFVRLNTSILMNLKFQELNRKAVAKILKKFDKHTALSMTTPTYQQFSRTHAPSTDKLLASSVARDMAAAIATELVALVPQIQDYLCPVCENIASYPMRPGCGHIICSRCMNKMLRKKMFRCPMCRIDVTKAQNAPEVDWKREKLNLKYFPAETKEKHHQDKLERGRELYGENYNPNECIVM